MSSRSHSGRIILQIPCFDQEHMISWRYAVYFIFIYIPLVSEPLGHRNLNDDRNVNANVLRPLFSWL